MEFSNPSFPHSVARGTSPSPCSSYSPPFGFCFIHLSVCFYLLCGFNCYLLVVTNLICSPNTSREPEKNSLRSYRYIKKIISLFLFLFHFATLHFFGSPVPIFQGREELFISGLCLDSFGGFLSFEAFSDISSFGETQGEKLN